MRLLNFHRQALQEFQGQESHSGLMIFGRGLGLERILNSMLSIHLQPHNLVLLLNVKETEFMAIRKDLEADSLASRTDDALERIHMNLLNLIDNSTPAKDRTQIYLNGGVISVTSRILVVDILNGVIPTNLITGIIINHAERVTENGSIAFILRLFRTINATGFIRAFSDCPERFGGEVTKLERTLKTLQVRNLYLYPRFQMQVSDEINSNGSVELVEIRVPFSKAMNDIQNGLMDCLSQILNELKRLYPHLDLEDLQIENSLFRSLDQLVRTRLEPVWHLASTKTKQMVEDLKVLRSLFSYLVNYDSVTFYLYLETIKEANKLARGAGYSNLYSWLLLDGSNIVFDCGRSRVYDKITKPNGSSEFVPKFDVQPKWKVLVQIIKEIEAERATFDKKSSRNVLIFTPDGRVSYQIRTLISKLDMSFKDKKRNKAIYENTLNFQLESYLKSKENMNKVTSHFSKSLPSAPNGTGNKRRRVLPNKRTDDTQDVINYSTLEVSQPEIYCDTGHSHIYVRSTSSFGEDDTHWNMLYEIMPQWIILYSPDITLVRRIEVFKALFPSKQLKVYFLVYDNSVEEQQYLTTLTKEKSAFQQLIEKKGSISIPIDENGNVVIDMAQKFWSQVDSRNAGGQELKRQILVDVREFQSSLPMSIYSRGCDVIPCTLEVGDYILSPQIAVERKSPSDLASSLKSGRLYKQTKAMALGYAKSVLLIEFPQPSSFKLTFSQYERDMDVPKRLSLFCLHFPDVALIWACSPMASAEIFEDLQKTEDDPDLEAAIAVGKDVEGIETNLNPLLSVSIINKEILLCIPGITFKNYQFVMTRVNNLQALSCLGLEECKALIGPEGKDMYAFFNTEISNI